MILPLHLQQYMTSNEYDQGTLIAARRDLLLKSLKDAMDLLTAKPTAKTPLVMEAYGKSVDLFKSAAANVGGVCQCLAIKWVKFKMKEQKQGLTGKNKVLPDTRVDQLRLQKTLDKAAARQSEVGKLQVYTMSFQKAMQLYNVSPRIGWDRQTSLTDVAARVMGIVHGYFVVGIKAPKYGGNHAIGIYTSGGGAFGSKKHAYVFDPNYGEMAFPLNEFGTLFQDLVQSCYNTGMDDVVCFAQFDPT